MHPWQAWLIESFCARQESAQNEHAEGTGGEEAPQGGLCGRAGCAPAHGGRGARGNALHPAMAGHAARPCEFRDRCEDQPPFGYGDGGPDGWWITFEPELHLEEDIVVPDLAGWRRTTMPDYPDAAYCAIAPDWTCEVLSHSTRRIDRHEKAAIYAREGVSHLWFVDPDAKTLEAFELNDHRWMLLATLADDEPVSLPPFDAISFPLDTLWPESVAANGDAA